MTEMKQSRTEVDAPAESPCAACPWLTRNHGKSHPQNYYSDTNRRRLWTGLRTGKAPGMTCYPTDPQNQPVKDDVRTRECAGAWIILAREMKAFEAVDGINTYRKGRKLALTREGFLELMAALMPWPLGRGRQGLVVKDDPGVSIGLGTGR